MSKHLFNKVKEKCKELPSVKVALSAVLLGAAILLIPQQKKVQPVIAEETKILEPEQLCGIEERMEAILSAVEGAGRVEVMLVTKNDGITEYQTDVEEIQQGDMLEIRTQTVFSDADENGGALIKRKTAPEYLGAVVISRGADSADVRLQLTKAVCSLTGLGSDKVTVLKMESNY